MSELREQPDFSPGDVISAEKDGTIVLDDGITTWNPTRACEFLLARERAWWHQNWHRDTGIPCDGSSAYCPLIQRAEMQSGAGFCGKDSGSR